MIHLHQASCIAIGTQGILIEGPPGSGKSSLALALIDRGAQLVGDDGVALEQRGAALWASPAPATAGLIEIRNVGLVPLAPCNKVQIGLVIMLDPAAPRYLEQAEPVLRGGCTLPLIRLWPDSPVLHLRAEAALLRYGLAQ